MIWKRDHLPENEFRKFTKILSGIRSVEKERNPKARVYPISRNQLGDKKADIDSESGFAPQTTVVAGGIRRYPLLEDQIPGLNLRPKAKIVQHAQAKKVAPYGKNKKVWNSYFE